MKIKFNRALLVFVVAGLLAGVLFAYGSASAGGGEEIGNSTPMYDFQDHGGVEILFRKQRGTSELVRDAEGISMSFDTTDLPVGAFTVWWVIFNNPTACSNDDCGSSDTRLGGPARASILWATGGIVGPDRIGHASAHLKVGLDNAPGYVHRGPGLTNPIEAEVHIVIKYHGPPQYDNPEILALQLTSFVGDCARLLCYLPQSGVHRP
ncbi:MAG: hypothetical protein IH963_00085 [Chloroflexi bacterium]|nr:hypothetical protein [Chloroflexota bacterium]